MHEPPIESVLDRDRRELAERDAAWERARRARARAARAAEVAATPAPPDWSSYVRDAIAAERNHMMQLLEETIAEIEARAHERIDDAMRPLRVELAELKISNCELRIQNSRLRELLAERGNSAGVAGISSGALN